MCDAACSTRVRFRPAVHVSEHQCELEKDAMNGWKRVAVFLAAVAGLSVFAAVGSSGIQSRTGTRQVVTGLAILNRPIVDTEAASAEAETAGAAEDTSAAVERLE